MPVVCMHKDFGCQWAGDRAGLDTHLTKSCPYESIKHYLHQQQQKEIQLKDELRAVRKENESLKSYQHETKQQLDTTINQLSLLFPGHFALDPDLPLDTQQEVVLTETQRLQHDVEALSATMTSLELKQNMALMTETFRLQEELQSLRAVCHGMRMQMHYLMVERRGAMIAPPPPPPHPDQEGNGYPYQNRRSWLGKNLLKPFLPLYLRHLLFG